MTLFGFLRSSQPQPTQTEPALVVPRIIPLEKTSMPIFRGIKDMQGVVSNAAGSPLLTLMSYQQPRPFEKAGQSQGGYLALPSRGSAQRCFLFYRASEVVGQQPSPDDMVLMVEEKNSQGAWGITKILHGEKAFFAMSFVPNCCDISNPCLLARYFTKDGDNFKPVTTVRLSQMARDSRIPIESFFEKTVDWTIANDDAKKKQLMEAFWHLTGDKTHTCANDKAFGLAYRNG